MSPNRARFVDDTVSDTKHSTLGLVHMSEVKIGHPGFFTGPLVCKGD